MYIEPINVDNKKKKNVNWLLILIIFITIIIFVIMGLIFYLNSTKLEVSINKNKISIGKDIAKDTFIIDKENNKVYISIKDIAKAVGYESHK